MGKTVIKVTPGGRHRARRTWWRDQLMTVVAEAHFCRAIIFEKTELTSVVGRDSDRAITLAMYEFLLATMRRLAAKADRGRARRAKTFRRSFYAGFITAILAAMGPIARGQPGSRRLFGTEEVRR